MEERIFFDLNEVPVEENSINARHEETATEEHSQNNKTIFDEPFVGQYFLSEEEALIFYQNYARKKGFSVRKGRFMNKKTGERKRRDFFCHHEGKSEFKKDYTKKKKTRNRGYTRCECKAHMRITLIRINEIFPEEWQVTKFVAAHNHVLLNAQEVRFLPSYRNITLEDEKHILLLKEGGFTVKMLKMKNLNFQYASTLDSESKLEHIFWCHAHCFELYQKYGDVVVFDITYKVNSYDMPFGIFVGIDNHGRTILFGCALLRNEKLKTFEWLFKNFTLLMKKSPKTILTDQDPWMKQAIETEMPYTKHAFCIWHITTKFSSWFTSVLRSEYSSWCTEFHNLYKLDSVEEFEQQWPLVSAKYNLEKNKHVTALYQIKKIWVPSYLRGFFFGCMTTTGRSESINSFIKKIISSNTCLIEFIRQVDLTIEDVGHRQMHDSMVSKCQESHLRSLSPLEKQGYQVLTPYAFKKFQDQFAQAIQYSVREENGTSFIVKHYKAVRQHQVVWDGKTAKCTSKNFEFVGILCRHILSVLLHKGSFEIPSNYWLSRWKGNVDASSSCGNNSDLVTNAIELVRCPVISQTKGRPKQKRMKSGKELARQVKRCRLCRSSSHNFTTCPERESNNA
uniref:Protein FAR1-RELATED SEQUENCE n=1 Tax=Lactuca sativa TaxID=4236 RepID=A0A9R1V8C6_LACSA|nr:hypothetical protein LSAT_V11C600301820 [Lactuca sativa]